MASKRIKDWATSITAFRTGDVIPVDGPSGTAKMPKDDLLRETSQNALAGNVAPAFDPTRDNTNPYKAGESVTYNGKTYTFRVDHYGAWNSDDVDSTTFDDLYAGKKVALEDNRVLVDLEFAALELFTTSNTHYGDDYDDFVGSPSARWFRSALIDVGDNTTAYLKSGCHKTVHPVVYFNSEKIVIGYETSTANSDKIEERNLVFPADTKYIVVQSCYSVAAGIRLNDAVLKLGVSVIQKMDLTFDDSEEQGKARNFFANDSTKFSTTSSLDKFNPVKNPKLVTYTSADIGTTKYGDGQGTQYGNSWYSTGLIPKQDFMAELGIFRTKLVVPVCFYDADLVLVAIENLYIERNNLFQYSYLAEDFPAGAEYFVLQYSIDYGTPKLFLRGSDRSGEDEVISTAGFSEENVCSSAYLWRDGSFGVFINTDTVGMSYFAKTGHTYGARWQRSSLIRIPNGVSRIQASLWEYRTIPPVVFFDKDGISIGYTTPNKYNSLETQTFDVPAGAVYFCLQSDNTGDNPPPGWSNLSVWYKFSDLSSIHDQYTLLNGVVGYKNTRFAWLGDSITDPSHIGTTKNYWQFLEEMLGLKSYSYGVNGAQSNQIITQVDAAIAAATADGEKIDVLSLFFGTNDYNADVPIGEWYTETEESVVRHGSTVTLKKKVFNTNNSTFKGRLYNGVLYAKQQLPDTKIIVITPIHRGQYGNEANRQPSELYANALGLYIDDYIAAVKELGNVLAVEVIDLNAICGLYPLLDEFAKFFNSSSDKLHPNARGHYRMACALANKLVATNNKV